ncbi:MAG: ParA family protein [Romboutsia sp.]|nr:ParA family protein [Romboutsia sp.]
MKKITMFNIKGGVGKTTSTINVAAVLASQNKKVLIVDLDPQANATMAFKQYDINDLSISDLLLYKEKNICSVIKNTDYENIDIIPSNIKLIPAESEILRNITKAQQTRLKKILLEAEDKYDYCLIDCPTYPNMLTVNALTASDMVMIPIKIDKYSMDGLEYLMDYIEDIRYEFNPNLKLGGCFITMYSNTNVNKQIKDELKEMLGDLLYDTVIRTNIIVVESTFVQKPLIDYKKKSHASIDYEKLVKEVF